MRGKMTTGHKVLGVSLDGIVIYEPKLAPQTVSKAKIRSAVETVKARHKERGSAYADG